jgi:hypothetical protein
MTETDAVSQTLCILNVHHAMDSVQQDVCATILKLLAGSGRHSKFAFYVMRNDPHISAVYFGPVYALYFNSELL